MKKEHIKHAQFVVSKLPEPKLDKCYVMFCPETGEFFVDAKPASVEDIAKQAISEKKSVVETLNSMCLGTTTDINFAFRAQKNPDAFCQLAERISNLSEKKWYVIQCHTTCVPMGMFLSKKERE